MSNLHVANVDGKILDGKILVNDIHFAEVFHFVVFIHVMKILKTYKGTSLSFEGGLRCA